MERPKRTRRRVVHASVTEEDIEEYAESRQWERWASYPRDIASAQDHEVQWLVEDGLILDYLECYLTNDGCILSAGYDEIQAERLMREVEADLELLLYSESDLLDTIKAASDLGDLPGLGRALIRAGLGAPLRYDRAFFDCIVANATSSPEYHIRVFAICSMVYTEWPEFVPILRDILTNDHDERVRVRAEIVLNAYIAAGIGRDS